jgi:transglutaminase/protease-like cytokinesis protein 3
MGCIPGKLAGNQVAPDGSSAVVKSRSYDTTFSSLASRNSSGMSQEELVTRYRVASQVTEDQEMYLNSLAKFIPQSLLEQLTNTSQPLQEAQLEKRKGAVLFVGM